MLIGVAAAIMFSRVVIAGAAGFATADLSGNWFLCGSDLQENQTWDGNVVLSTTGAVTGGSLNGSDGSAYSLVGGSLSIDDTGGVTGTITDSDNATIQLTMHMDPAKGLIAGEGNSVGGAEDGVFMLVRKAAGFANADLSGNWFLCGSDLQENQTWDGNVVLSTTGAVTGGSLNGSDGSAYSLVGGSLSIDDTGRVTGTITDSDNATIQLTMHMVPAKGLIAGEGNSVGGAEDGVFMLVRKAQPIIGPWQFGDGQANGSGVLIFLENGTYFHAEDTVGNATESDGMERGTYSWNDVTKVLSIQVQVDTNGEIGLSDAEGTLTATITGDSMSIGDNTGASTLTRVVSATLPLVGAWHFGGGTAESGALVFLPNNVYFHAEDIVADQFEFDGMERGTYSWNPASGLLSATPSVDTNGEVGLSHPAGPFTAKVVGDGLRIRDNSGTQPMNRVTHLPGTLSISGIVNGQVTIQFQGTLQSSSDLSNWADVSTSPTSPLTVIPGSAPEFYVSRGR